MKLYTPSEAEAKILLEIPSEFNGWVVRDGSLPPTFLFDLALASAENPWIMPRLFQNEETGEIVGSGGYKSAPVDGRIEIGYGVAPDSRRRGYATSGVKLLLEYAFASGCVDEVLAETALDNMASQKVLMKLDFEYYDEAERDEGTVMLWRMKR